MAQQTVDRTSGNIAALTLVGPFTQLFVVGCLLNDVQNGIGELHKHIQQ